MGYTFFVYVLTELCGTNRICDVVVCLYYSICIASLIIMRAFPAARDEGEDHDNHTHISGDGRKTSMVGDVCGIQSVQVLIAESESEIINRG